MAATLSEIKGWLTRGQVEGATHVIVVCDDFDFEDYPVYVGPDEDVREKEREYNAKEMQRVMEVYSLRLPIGPQLAERRAFHYD